MRRIISVYSTLLAVLIIMILVPLWALLLLYGKGDGFSRSLSIGEIWYDTKILTVFTVVMAPAAVFALCCVLWRLAKAAVPAGVSAIWGFCTFQATLFLALYLIFAAPWSTLLSMDWRGAWPDLISFPDPVQLPSDEDLEYPALPLADEEPTDPYAYTLYDLDGNDVPMSQFKDKVLFFNLWTTWCGFCRLEFPHIERLYEALRETPNIAFVLVSPEDPAVVRAWVDTQTLKLPFYTIQREDIPDDFKRASLPTTFIIAPGGRTVFRHAGAVRWNGLKTQQFLQGLAAQIAGNVEAAS